MGELCFTLKNATDTGCPANLPAQKTYTATFFTQVRAKSGVSPGNGTKNVIENDFKWHNVCNDAAKVLLCRAMTATALGTAVTAAALTNHVLNMFSDDKMAGHKIIFEDKGLGNAHDTMKDVASVTNAATPNPSPATTYNIIVKNFVAKASAISAADKTIAIRFTLNTWQNGSLTETSANSTSLTSAGYTQVNLAGNTS